MKKPEPKRKAKPDGPREIPEGYVPFDANFFTSDDKTPVVFDLSLGKGQFCPVKTTFVGLSKSKPGCYMFLDGHGYDLPVVNMYGCLLNGGPLVAYFKRVTKEDGKHSDANPPAKDQKPSEEKPEEDEAQIPPWLKPFQSSEYRNDSRTPVIFRVCGPNSRIQYYKARLKGTDFAGSQFKFCDDRSGDPLPVVNLLGKSINTGNQLAYFDLRKAEKIEVPATGPRPKYLKPGFWREEGGGKAEVVAVNNSGTPKEFIAIGWDSQGNGAKWTFDGRTSSPLRAHNLVEPWVDRVEWNWEWAPPWVEWIILNISGQWFMYAAEPTHTSDGFVTPLNGHLDGLLSWRATIPPEYAPKWTGDWRNSKTKRPSKP